MKKVCEACKCKSSKLYIQLQKKMKCFLTFTRNLNSFYWVVFIAFSHKTETKSTLKTLAQEKYEKRAKSRMFVICIGKMVLWVFITERFWVFTPLIVYLFCFSMARFSYGFRPHRSQTVDYAASCMLTFSHFVFLSSVIFPSPNKPAFVCYLQFNFPCSCILPKEITDESFIIYGCAI